jgi:hypothetical protein
LAGDKVSHLGGIVSDMYSPATVTNCYNIGHFGREGTPSISTTSSTGRIVGSGGGKHSTAAANIFNSYYLNIVSGENEFADCDLSLGGQGWLPLSAGLDEAEMKTAAFVRGLNGEGSAFNADSENINGGFPILAWQGGTPVPTVGAPGSGDLDGDGAVTMAEVMTILNYVLNSAGSTLSAAQIAAADMDGDGVITMVDVMMMLQTALA